MNVIIIIILHTCYSKLRAALNAFGQVADGQQTENCSVSGRDILLLSFVYFWKRGIFAKLSMLQADELFFFLFVISTDTNFTPLIIYSTNLLRWLSIQARITRRNCGSRQVQYQTSAFSNRTKHFKLRKSTDLISNISFLKRGKTLV